MRIEEDREIGASENSTPENDFSERVCDPLLWMLLRCSVKWGASTDLCIRPVEVAGGNENMTGVIWGETVHTETLWGSFIIKGRKLEMWIPRAFATRWQILQTLCILMGLNQSRDSNNARGMWVKVIGKTFPSPMESRVQGVRLRKKHRQFTLPPFIQISAQTSSVIYFFPQHPP